MASVKIVLRLATFALQLKRHMSCKVLLHSHSRKPREDTYPQGCLKGYPRVWGRVMELILIGDEFLSYQSLIGQLKHPFRHP